MEGEDSEEREDEREKDKGKKIKNILLFSSHLTMSTFSQFNLMVLLLEGSLKPILKNLETKMASLIH